ncbi:MAG TPA: HAMP domain-containing protein, partial [Chloroflexota bacterium]|nr:HAMP domain-containing protein [Chloroflexota bacterium]
MIGVGLAALPGLLLAIGSLIEAGVLTSATPTLLFEIIGAFVVVICLDAIGALYVAGQILTPVEAIRSAALDWKHGDFSKRIAIEPSSAEFAALVDGLNSMAAGLEESRIRIQDAEQRLRLETDRLRTILDTSPAGIVVMNTDETVQLSNPAAEALLGEQLVANIPAREYRVVQHLYRPDGQPYSYEDLPEVQSLRNGAEVSGAEIIVRRPNGWEAHLLVNSAPI